MKICTEILERNPYDQVCARSGCVLYTYWPMEYHLTLIQTLSPRHSSSLPLQAPWFLKARALTEQTYVDEVEMEEEGIAELLLDDTAIADLASKISNAFLIDITVVAVLHACVSGGDAVKHICVRICSMFVSSCISSLFLPLPLCLPPPFPLPCPPSLPTLSINPSSVKGLARL